MNTYMMMVLAMVGLGCFVLIYRLIRRGQSFSKRLPIVFITCFLIYGFLGMTGFLMENQITTYPGRIAGGYGLVAIMVGFFINERLYNKWKWSMQSGFLLKQFYLLGLSIFNGFVFFIVFLLCEHKGFPEGSIATDIVWQYSFMTFFTLVPALIKHLYTLLDEIPLDKNIIPLFELPIGSSAPLIEIGGEMTNFRLIVPVNYRGQQIIETRVRAPLATKLGDVFHYKLEEHNVIKKRINKISIAEDNKFSKLYGWYFYRKKPMFWGWYDQKKYLDPAQKIGGFIGNGEKIYGERVKLWQA